MNARRGQQGGGRGGGRQVQQQQEQQGNQPLGPTAGEVFAEIMAGVDRMAPTIQDALPKDVSFRTFRATLMTAMRVNPDIMHCNAGSIITGAMKAAIDGVLLDGKEAALVPSSNKVKDFQTGREFYRKEARYNIMVAGLRKSIIKGGKVRDLQSTVVYANEQFNYRRGLDPDLTHIPILDAAKRGDPVGAYSVAWFADGGAPSFEVMNKAEIMAVKDMAQSGPVWKGPVATEMWRKTVVRRHRKALPGQETRMDMEAHDDFPMFGGAQLDINAGKDGVVLPAKQQAADAPRRADFAQLEGGGGENGVPVDFGNSGEMTAEEVEREERGGDAPQEQQQQAAPAEEQRQERTVGAVPEGFDTWQAWEEAVATRMKVAATLPKLDAIVSETQALFEQAPDDVRSNLSELYTLKSDDHRAAVQ